MEQLKLYNIDMKYVSDLHNADDRVESVSPQMGKENRVFIGIVVTHNDRKYCIPLSHPLEKFLYREGYAASCTPFIVI